MFPVRESDLSKSLRSLPIPPARLCVYNFYSFTNRFDQICIPHLLSLLYRYHVSTFVSSPCRSSPSLPLSLSLFRLCFCHFSLPLYSASAFVFFFMSSLPLPLSLFSVALFSVRIVGTGERDTDRKRQRQKRRE